jgi:hypothetical protein
VTETYFDKVSHTTLLASLASPLHMLAPTLDAVSAFIDANSTMDTVLTPGMGMQENSATRHRPATAQSLATTQSAATQAAAAHPATYDNTPAP